MKTTREREQRNSELASIRNARYGRSLLMCMFDAGTGVEEICPTFRRVGPSSRGSAYDGLHQCCCEVGHLPSAIHSFAWQAHFGGDKSSSAHMN